MAGAARFGCFDIDLVCSGIRSLGRFPAITVKITANLQSVKETKPHEIMIRFVAGGIVTAFAGFIGKEYGPAVGGLFLAFPAILPASATLINKHERERKEKLGLHGRERGRKAAAADAAGAAMGSIALLIFALLAWQFVPTFRAWAVLVCLTMIWFGIAYAAWRIRKAWRPRLFLHSYKK